MTFIGSLSGSGNSAAGSMFNLGATGAAAGSGISGLASGINTDNIVNGLVQAAQVPLVQLMQQRQILQWQEQQYQQVNASLTALQTSVSNLQLQSTFDSQSASSSDAAVVNPSISSNVVNGAYQVSVSQLAQGATTFSNAPLSGNGATTLSTLGYASGVTLNVNGSSVTFQGTDTVDSVLAGLTANSSMGVTGFYDSNANNVVLQTSATGSGAKIIVDGTSATFLKSAFNLQSAANLTSQTVTTASTWTSGGSVEINGHQFTFTASPGTPLTESQVEAEINLQSSVTGVTATHASQTGQLLLEGTSTSANGSAQTLISPISVSDPNNFLGFANAYPSSTQKQQVAQDASYVVNGYSSTSPTNQVSYNGLSLSLQGLTGSTPVTVTVSANVSNVVNAIQGFVQQYNTTLQLMQNLYYQKSSQDYRPLTTQQASQMTQKQIDEWNQKAQTGLLSNDALLGATMNDIETVANGVFSGQSSSTVSSQVVTMNSLASIGISPIDPYMGVSSGNITPGVTTSGWNSYGLLQINTSQLTASIQADPQAVMRLFTNNPTLPGDNPTMGTGIAVQLFQSLTNDISQVTKQAGANLVQPDSSAASATVVPLLSATPIDPNADLSALFGADGLDTSSLGQQVTSMDSQATNMQQQIDSLRQRYQNQFSQMEKALSQLSTQSSYFAGMLGGGSPTGG